MMGAVLRLSCLPLEERQAKFIAGAEPPKRRRGVLFRIKTPLEFLYGIAHHFSLGTIN